MAQNFYDDSFNPEDVSNWLDESPIKLLAALSSNVGSKIDAIDRVAITIRELPGIDQLVLTSRWGKSVSAQEMMDWILEDLHKIQRIMRTAMVYNQIVINQDQESDEV